MRRGERFEVPNATPHSSPLLRFIDCASNWSDIAFLSWYLVCLLVSRCFDALECRPIPSNFSRRTAPIRTVHDAATRECHTECTIHRIEHDQGCGAARGTSVGWSIPRAIEGSII